VLLGLNEIDQSFADSLLEDIKENRSMICIYIITLDQEDLRRRLELELDKFLEEDGRMNKITFKHILR
jgi:hypothetical protein